MLHKKPKSRLCCIVPILYYSTGNFIQPAVVERLETAGFPLSEDLRGIKQEKMHPSACEEEGHYNRF